MINNGPTPISNSTAGLPLAQTSIKTQTNSPTPAGKRAAVNEEISDTLETSERESDGRQLVQIQRKRQPQESNNDGGSRLDLLG